MALNNAYVPIVFTIYFKQTKTLRIELKNKFPQIPSKTFSTLQYRIYFPLKTFQYNIFRWYTAPLLCDGHGKLTPLFFSPVLDKIYFNIIE